MFIKMSIRKTRLLSYGLHLVLGLLALGVPTLAAQAQTIAVVVTQSEIDLSKPGQVIAKVKRLASDTANDSLDKFVHGEIKIEPGSNGAPQVVVSWTALSSDPGGSDAVALAPPLQTKQAAGQTKLQPGSTMAVTGDVNVLIRGSRTIAQNSEVPQSDDTQSTAESSSDGSGSGGSSTSDAGLGASLDRTQAELPEMQAVTATETVETIVNNDVYGSTADGCTPEMSEDGTEMHILVRPTKNGEANGECAVGVETAKIDFTYVGCGYEKDVSPDVMGAYAQRRSYYVYGGTSTPVDTECTSVTDIAYTITETEKGCKIVSDLSPGVMQAKQFTALVFTGRENEIVPVEDCKERNGREFQIKAALCGLRDDFTAKRTFEQDIATYVGQDGLKRNIGDCTDTTRYYVHDFDTSICEPFADYTTNNLYEQYRVKIDIDPAKGFDEFRTNTCKPFDTALTGLQETQAGCESLHFDYVGQSLGAKRIIRKDTGALVRECRESDISYSHYYLPEGWVRDDANLQSIPQEATYIDLPHPAGKTLVAAGVVLEGAEPVPYTLQGSVSENGGTEFIPNSCDKYLKQKKMESWTRPDGSIFVTQNGFNPSIGPSYACISQIDQTWAKVSDQGTSSVCSRTVVVSDDGRESRDCVAWAHTCRATYQGSRKLIREDGQTVITTTHNHAYSGGVAAPSHRCPASVGYTQQWGINLGLL